MLPVDISLSADDRTLFVDCFGDGKCRVFDVSNPQQPRQIHEQQIGRQVNMVSQSWDGKRLYFSSSLLANWDKAGADNEQFVKAYGWDGRELTPKFALDFTALKSAPAPHSVRFVEAGAEPGRKGGLTSDSPPPHTPMKTKSENLPNRPSVSPGAKVSEARVLPTKSATAPARGWHGPHRVSLILGVMVLCGLLAFSAERDADHDYDAPQPGTTLPVIKQAADGALLDSTGKPVRLADLTHGRITVLSFIYTRCAAAKACPMATGVLMRLHRESGEDAKLAARLRLVSLSFDPVNDTPERMAAYSQLASLRPTAALALRYDALPGGIAADPRSLRTGGGPEAKSFASHRTVEPHVARLSRGCHGQHPQHLQLGHAGPEAGARRHPHVDGGENQTTEQHRAAIAGALTNGRLRFCRVCQFARQEAGGNAQVQPSAFGVCGGRTKGARRGLVQREITTARRAMRKRPPLRR